MFWTSCTVAMVTLFAVKITMHSLINNDFAFVQYYYSSVTWQRDLLICIRLGTEGNVLDMNWLQAAKELVKLNKWWKFGCNIRGDIIIQQRKNLWMTEALISSYSLYKILTFWTCVAQKVFNTSDYFSLVVLTVLWPFNT